MPKVNFAKIIQLQLTHVFVEMLWPCRAPVKGRSCDFILHKLLIFCIVRTFAIRSVLQLIKRRQLLKRFYIQGSKQTSSRRHQPTASSKAQLNAITWGCSPLSACSVPAKVVPPHLIPSLNLKTTSHCFNSPGSSSPCFNCTPLQIDMRKGTQTPPRSCQQKHSVQQPCLTQQLCVIPMSFQALTKHNTVRV